MNQPTNPLTTIQLVDLVLDPHTCCDRLLAPVREGLLDDNDTDRLTTMLNCAIAQLDAIGDEYGAMELASLHNQLAQLQPAL